MEAAEDTGVSEESAPSETVRPSEALSQDQSSRVGTAVLEEVIGTLGRVDLFGAACLKALHGTCTAFRDIVDATDALTAAKFSINLWSGDGLDLLQTCASGSRLMRGDHPLRAQGRARNKARQRR